MTQTDDDEWAKVREMVRNAPPGSAQTQWNPHELADETPHRTFPVKGFIIVLLLCLVAGGAYYAFEHRDELLGAATSAPGVESRTTSDAAPVSPAAAPASAPAAQSKVPSESTPVSLRKGAKNVNVRASASAASAVVGKLSAGDRAEKIGESEGWVRLRFQSAGKSTEGWVRRDLLGE